MQKPMSVSFELKSPAYQTIGHRGAGFLAAENSLQSFILAKKLGLTWVEFDTQPCATGEWVLMHDDSLERCTNGSGLLVNTPWEILQTLQIGKEFPTHPHPQIGTAETIPLLSTALDTLSQLGIHPNIEIKSLHPITDKALDHFLNIIETHWPKSKPLPMISSFNPEVLFAIKDRTAKFPLKFPLGYNIESLQPDTLDIFRKGNFFSLHCDHTQLSSEALLELLQEEAPFHLLLYTVNDPILAQDYFHKGVWAIFSDTPNFIAQSFNKA